jgi:putative hydrolase of the HAD superfamily
MAKSLLLDFYGVIQSDNLLIWVDRHEPQFPNLRAQADDICRRLDLDEITLDQYYEELAIAANMSTDEARQEMASDVAINTPLLELVDELHAKGVNVSILSNDGSSLRGYIDDLGIAHHFHQIFVSGELGMMKPDQRIYSHVAEQLRLEPHNILFIDDKQSNVDGAIRAGLQSVVYQSAAQVRQLVADLL